MPVIQTIKLPTFLPTLADQLRKLLPPNHDSTSTMLGLVLLSLPQTHASRQTCSTEQVHAGKCPHHKPLLKRPSHPVPSSKGHFCQHSPVKELTALQIRLTSLENMLANLAKATTEARKEFKSQSHINANPAKPTLSNAKGFALTPTYAAKAAVPQRPSVVVRVSATKWTTKGNLVFWGGTNTTAHQLTSSIPHFSEALQTLLLAIAESAPETLPTLCPNVKWSKIRFNAVPTGKTDTQGAYMPDEVHNALVIENPAYAALTIIQKPSWVRDPSTYSSSAISSFSVSFENPDGTSVQTLLHHKTFYAFGHVATVKC
ncbi:hypothetical protein BGY98DRAFT_940409 [Russula aff. rugulosa BPL654]|nr:hypothetical protein BGY98DRAFT_940409 [Russula aff. rugulosa BPL654]